MNTGCICLQLLFTRAHGADGEELRAIAVLLLLLSELRSVV